MSLMFLSASLGPFKVMHVGASGVAAKRESPKLGEGWVEVLFGSSWSSVKCRIN